MRKMVVKEVEIKNRSYYFWDDAVYFEDFDPKMIKIDKKESRADVNLVFIGYIVKKPEYNIDNVNPLYLIIRSLEGYVEKIPGTDDKYIVIMPKDILDKFNVLWKDIEDKITNLVKNDYDKIKFSSKSSSKSVSIEDKHKIRFNSDTTLPLNTSITFHALTLVIRCVFDKNDVYYPGIHLDDALFEDGL